MLKDMDVLGVILDIMRLYICFEGFGGHFRFVRISGDGAFVYAKFHSCLITIFFYFMYLWL